MKYENQAERDALAIKYPWIYRHVSCTGMSDGYEEATRWMIRSGVEWLATHPIEGHQLREGTHAEKVVIFDILMPFVASVEEGCSGAMVGMATNHAAYAYKNGWQAYQDQLGLGTEAKN